MQPATPISYPAIVGFTIAKLRQGRSQESIADALGIGQSGYSKLERGVVVMTVPQLRVVAEQLEVAEQEILDLAAALRSACEAKKLTVIDDKAQPDTVAEVTALLEDLWRRVAA